MATEQHCRQPILANRGRLLGVALTRSASGVKVGRRKIFSKTSRLNTIFTSSNTVVNFDWLSTYTPLTWKTSAIPQDEIHKLVFDTIVELGTRKIFARNEAMHRFEKV